MITVFIAKRKDTDTEKDKVKTEAEIEVMRPEPEYPEPPPLEGALSPGAFGGSPASWHLLSGFLPPGLRGDMFPLF